MLHFDTLDFIGLTTTIQSLRLCHAVTTYVASHTHASAGFGLTISGPDFLLIL
jgi:hypothetical protein